MSIKNLPKNSSPKPTQQESMKFNLKDLLSLEVFGFKLPFVLILIIAGLILLIFSFNSFVNILPHITEFQTMLGLGGLIFVAVVFVVVVWLIKDNITN